MNETEARTASTGHRPVLLLLVLAVGAAYANALTAGFQFDDWNVVVDEKRVAGLAAWWHSMPGIRPLLKLSYALNGQLSTGPFGYHLVNVAIHAANACLVFALLARRSTRFVAATAALIFALHPVQTEAVTYVMGRSCSLSTLLVFSSFYVTGWLALVFFACALGVRETAVMAVFVKWAEKRAALSTRRLLPFLLVLLAAAILALAIPKYRHLLSVSLHTRDIATNLLTQANGVTWLMGQLVRIDRLNVDPHLPVISSWNWTVAAEAMFLLGLIALGFALLKKHPAVGFGILWFFLWLLPTNSFLPRLDVANDRQLYVAMAGPAFLVAYGLGRLAMRRGPRIPVAIVVVVCVVLGAATHVRNRVYRDELSFWSDVVAKAPQNARAHNNLGYALALAHRDDEAEAEFRRALEIDPDYYKAVFNLMFLQEGTLRDRRESH